MKLYLMRHGQALGKQQDPQQGLSEAGKEGIACLANSLRDKPVAFTRAWHSPKTRARQTAEIMTRVLSPEAELRERDDINPTDNPGTLIEEIWNWHEDTLVVSHLPYVPELLRYLVRDMPVVEFVPGTLVCLNFDNDGVRLEWVVSP